MKSPYQRSYPWSPRCSRRFDEKININWGKDQIENIMFNFRAQLRFGASLRSLEKQRIFNLTRQTTVDSVNGTPNLPIKFQESETDAGLHSLWGLSNCRHLWAKNLDLFFNALKLWSSNWILLQFYYSLSFSWWISSIPIHFYLIFLLDNNIFYILIIFMLFKYIISLIFLLTNI